MGTLGIVLGLLGAIGALRVPRLFVLVVPYCVAATFFFSLWPRSDPRYLAGVFLLLPLLMLHGARVAAALPAVLVEQGHTGAGRAAILAVVVGVAWLGGAPRPAEDSALPWVTLAFQLCVPLSVILWPRIGREGQGKRVSILLALMLSGIAGWRSLESLGGRASFQQPQVAQARATIEAALAERPVVITSDEIGRPAENINYYTGASAVYLSELLRWGVAPGYFLDRLLKDGFSVYLLLPPADARLWLESPYVHPWFAAEPIASIPPVRNREYFVASPHHDGVPLLLLRIHPRTPAARE
jgi:hypothetical protein